MRLVRRIEGSKLVLLAMLRPARQQSGEYGDESTGALFQQILYLSTA
jgi:hypothetical protein